MRRCICNAVVLLLLHIHVLCANKRALGQLQLQIQAACSRSSESRAMNVRISYSWWAERNDARKTATNQIERDAHIRCEIVNIEIMMMMS